VEKEVRNMSWTGLDMVKNGKIGLALVGDQVTFEALI